VDRDPSRLTQEFSKADRGGRILVDTGRNGYSATFAAAYAVRAKPGAPVSAPCTWEEVERGAVEPRTFVLRTMRDRVAAVGELWEEMSAHAQSIPKHTQG
jgi:bifunctional non-homologous end joining protein LigD